MKSILRAILLSGFLVGSLGAQSSAVTGGPSAATSLEPFRVTGRRVLESEIAGTNPVDHYSGDDVEHSSAFDVGEFLSQLPASSLGDEVLVLIDGHPTKMAMASLPPGMIQSIDVSLNGAMPQFGAYANGRVINIQLKKDASQAEARGAFTNSVEGGGAQQTVTLSGLRNQGKLRLAWSLNYRNQEALGAGERDFSRNQDHTARGGHDLRLLWGETSVVQAVSGPLNGVSGPGGSPVGVALTPENQTGLGLLPGNFLPGVIIAPQTTVVAAGQRRFNTADYRNLTNPSHSLSFSAEVTRALSEQIEFSLSLSADQRDSSSINPPPVSPTSLATRVPAAYNPFGQDVEVGLVHTGFGPVRSHSESRKAEVGFNFGGRVHETWRWNLSLSGSLGRSGQEARDLDQARFTAALAAADPAQRFNPFGRDPRNAALYPALTVLRQNRGRTTGESVDFFVTGPLFAAPGGPAKLLLGGGYNGEFSERERRNATGLADGTEGNHSDSGRIDARLGLPWIAEKHGRPGLQRLETDFFGGLATNSSSSGLAATQGAGLLWAPLKAVTLQANLRTRQLTPFRYVAGSRPLVTETFIDPRRAPATAADVQVGTHDFNGTSRGRQEFANFTLSVQPPAHPTLRGSVSYDRGRQQNLAGGNLEPQDVIYNETSLPGRVTRAAPSADDLARGQPGPILAVDTTPGDGGYRESTGLRFQLEYTLRTKKHGDFRVSGSGRRALSSRYEVLRGIPFATETSSYLVSPPWSLSLRTGWSNARWNVAADLSYTDALQSGSLLQPSSTSGTLQVGYKFDRPIRGKWGKDARVTLGASNLFTGAPNYADTVSGFRGGSALGKSYTLRVSVPL